MSCTRLVMILDYIRPICLPINGIPKVTAGTIMTTSGWGATDDGKKHYYCSSSLN